MSRYLVTAALPYANGPVHVGHAVGAYLPGDVYVRYLRLIGEDVLYICGTDEHGTPITVSAEAEGVSPQDIVDKYHKIQVDAFSQLGISFDNFSGTARKIHHEISQDIFKSVLDKNFIYEKTVERPYCPSCEKFLPDRYVHGTCPHCNAVDQRGDQCENCGKQLDSHELKDPYCSICHGTPEMRATKHWFFKLSEVSSQLKTWVEKNKHWPSNARNFALGWIKEGLQDRAITRDINWGIPVPVDGAEGKVLYVWFDAPIGYISSTKEWAEREGKDWLPYWSKGSKIVHFIGKDNIPFHTIIWPAVLMADGRYELPWQVASNEFLNLEGQKMSTSRGWVIWLHDLLNEFQSDPVRYYLMSIAPESSDSDFHLNEFQDKVNKELIGTLGNFINRTLSFISSKNNNVVPNSAKKEKIDEEIEKTIVNASENIGSKIENFKLKAGLEDLLHLAQAGNVYFQNKEPWKNENDTTLYYCANLCRTLAILMQPYLPDSAEKIWGMLNLEGKISEQSWMSASELSIEGGHKIGKVKALYSKIEDDQIESFKKKYLNLTKKEEIKEDDGKMPEVDFDLFKKLDLRVGLIKKASQHPDADKLLVLEVDLGGLGVKQIVGGIKNYKPEDLPGKSIIVVANLKPAKIRGVESQGMLLAADEDGSPVLLTTLKDVKPGSKIQ